MPFFQLFAASNIKVAVTFDNPHQPAYPGGELSGTVTINVSKAIAIRALIIKYQVVEHHNHVLGPELDDIVSGRASKYEGTLPILHEKEMTLYGDAKVGETTVKPGAYDYDFRIPIPPTAPPTMNEPFLIGTRNSCCCVGCDTSAQNCQCCGFKVAQALTIQHRVVAEVVVPRSSDKTSKVQNVPRVVGVYPANRFPPSLVVKQCEKSFMFDQCRMCPCHSIETSQQADFTMMAPRPYVLLSRGTHGQMDVFVRGKINSAFDIMLVRFAREIEPQSAKSQQVYQNRLRGEDDRQIAEFKKIQILGRHVPIYRETSQVIASVHSEALDEQSDPGRKLTLSYDHNMFSNMCTYIGRGVTVVYGLVLRMDYEGVCCGGVDAMRESRLPVTVVHDCGFVPENDYNFHAEDPPNCGPNLSASNRPMATAQMGQGFGQQQQPQQQQQMHHHHHNQHHQHYAQHQHQVQHNYHHHHHHHHDHHQHHSHHSHHHHHHHQGVHPHHHHQYQQHPSPHGVDKGPMLVVPAQSQEGMVGVASKWKTGGGETCNEAPLPPQAEPYVTYEPPVVDSHSSGNGAPSHHHAYSADEELDVQ